MYNQQVKVLKVKTKEIPNFKHLSCSPETKLPIEVEVMLIVQCSNE